jgi:hypothetical protein
MKVDKRQILEFLDARGQQDKATHVDAMLPPEVNLDFGHHRSALERLDVDLDELRSVVASGA